MPPKLLMRYLDSQDISELVAYSVLIKHEQEEEERERKIREMNAMFSVSGSGFKKVSKEELKRREQKLKRKQERLKNEHQHR
jgi:hypothetical protein